MNEELQTIYYVVNIEDDGTGLYRTSIVPKPAHGVNFELFSNVEAEKFSIDEEQRIISGAVMIPDKKILRKFKDGSGYYNCIFTKTSILNTVKKASKFDKFNVLNLNHSSAEEDMVKGVYLIESIILNSENKGEKYADLPDGTWVASFWVEDEDYWENTIKANNFNGFSVEIGSHHYNEDEIKDDMFTRINEILESADTDENKRKLISNLIEL